MKIALAQYPITGHADFSAWQKHISFWVGEAVNNKAQVLVFPEYGSMELVSLLSSEVQKSLPKQISELQKLRPDFLKTFSELAKKYNGHSS